jgi:SAM-dependent methyltransferase
MDQAENDSDKGSFHDMIMRLPACSWMAAALWIGMMHATGAGQVPGAAQAPVHPPDIFFAPTLYSVADEMLKLAGVGASDVVYDLGSGDGRILMLAAQKYRARAVGVEIDHRLAELSREIAREGEVSDRVRVIEGDLFAADISAATVVTLYLSPTVNARLEPKLRRELRPGTRIVSHQFGIGNWTPDRAVRAEDDGTDLLLWTIAAR